MLPSSRQRPHSVPSHRQSPEREKGPESECVCDRQRHKHLSRTTAAEKRTEENRAPPAESPRVAQLREAAPRQVALGEGVGHPSCKGRLSPAWSRPAYGGASLILIG
uniref:Uncharacterized protein n=1 Tax=Mus musculus TaxID=10090 RepID=Q8BQU8_MOUSE|nr:unnamed protein product [Mus musculus]